MDGLVAICTNCGATAVAFDSGARHDPSTVLTGVRLTQKELKIFGLVQRGLTNDEIADQLFVSPNTVKFHLKNMFRKLGVRSRRRMISHCVSRLEARGRTTHAF